jgi:adenine-specific DNA methylase
MAQGLAVAGEPTNKTQLRETITLIFPIPDQMIPINKEGAKDNLKRLLMETGFDYLTYCYGDADEEKFRNKDDQKLDHIRSEIGMNADGKAELNKIVDYLDLEMSGLLNE